MPFDAILAICPFPTINKERKITNGFLIGAPRYCKKCREGDCKKDTLQQANQAITHSVCSNGFSIFLLRFDAYDVLIAGVISDNNHHIRGERRQAYRKNIISPAIIQSWYDAVSQLNEFISSGISKTVRDSIAELHDVKRTTSVVNRNAESVIKEYSAGSSFGDKVENASPPLKALYKSITLLNSRLDMMSIITNPGYVTDGGLRNFPVMKIFYMIAKIFEEEAAQKQIRISVEGQSKNTPKLYKTFDAIPIVLIDNAVKYSLPNQEITVLIEDNNRGVNASISSFGPLVSKEEISRIFEKEYRTESAIQAESKGSGLGLHIAKIVADAHAVKIEYRAEFKTTMNKQKVGNNIFAFEIPGNS